MVSREEAIKIATDAALEWYEDDGVQPVDFVEAYQEDDGDWIVCFKVYGWLTSEWRVSEYKGLKSADIIGG